MTVYLTGKNTVTWLYDGNPGYMSVPWLYVGSRAISRSPWLYDGAVAICRCPWPKVSARSYMSMSNVYIAMYR